MQLGSHFSSLGSLGSQLGIVSVFPISGPTPSLDLGCMETRSLMQAYETVSLMPEYESLSLMPALETECDCECED